MDANRQRAFLEYLHMMEVLASLRGQEMLDAIKQAIDDMLDDVDFSSLPTYQKGVEDGIVTGVTEVARKLINKNQMSNDEIAEVSGLDLERILELRKEVQESVNTGS